MKIRAALFLIFSMLLAHHGRAQDVVAGYYVMEEFSDFMDLKPDSSFMKYSVADVEMAKLPHEAEDSLPVIQYGMYLFKQDTLYLEYFSDSTLQIEKFLLVKHNDITGFCTTATGRVGKIENSKKQLYAKIGREFYPCFRKELGYGNNQQINLTNENQSKQYYTKPVTTGILSIRNNKAKNLEWFYVSSVYKVNEMKLYYREHSYRRKLKTL